MKYLLLTLMTIVAFVAQSQTFIYKQKKIVENKRTYYCLVNEKDTIKISSNAMSLKGSDMHAIINGQRFDFKQKKDGPWTVTNSDSLIASARNKNFFNFKTPSGSVYTLNDSLKGKEAIMSYSINGQKVTSARQFKNGKDKCVEITILNSNAENIEFITMMTLYASTSLQKLSSKSSTLLIMSACLLMVKVATL